MRAFVEEDILDPEMFAAVLNDGALSRIPTESEVRDILQPFRPEHIRKAARVYVDCLTSNWKEPIFVRTCYGGRLGDEEKMLQWIPSSELSGNAVLKKEDRWWRLLNDESLFDVGDDWSKIYDVLPEVIAYRKDRRLNLDMGRVLISAKRNVRSSSWIAKLESAVQAEVQYQFKNTLIVFDKVFFDTYDLTEEQIYAIEEEEGENGALLVFLDGKGNQIRSCRVHQGILDDLDISYFRASTADLWFWEDATVGDKYKPEGEIGRRYYGSEGTEWTTEPANADIPRGRYQTPH